ncbi:MAG: hypothetical protein M1540_09295 [Candidatus Bathyarchaeota archaeon]|nr:hypothetical protein [Candidatus Bathyarchaeota archaeon]
MSVFDKIIREVKPGLKFKTPALGKQFTVKSVESDKIVFFIRTMEIEVSKESLNGIPDFLKEKKWVKIGAKHEATWNVDDFTLEKYLRKTTKSKSKHSQASYVAPLLEYLKIVEVDHTRPTQIRLLPKY